MDHMAISPQPRVGMVFHPAQDGVDGLVVCLQHLAPNPVFG